MAAVLVLFVRFVDPEAPHAPNHPTTPEPSHSAAHAPRRLVASTSDLALVRLHQMLFYALLVAAPLEWWLRGRPGGVGQLVGAGLTFVGVAGYRRAGRTLGAQLTPLIAPAEPAVLVEHGTYRRVRHPMYRAELSMAFGIPLLLDARWTLLVSVLFALAVLRRIGIEEQALAARLPAYPEYAARTFRLVPHVY